MASTPTTSSRRARSPIPSRLQELEEENRSLHQETFLKLDNQTYSLDHHLEDPLSRCWEDTAPKTHQNYCDPIGYVASYMLFREALYWSAVSHVDAGLENMNDTAHAELERREEFCRYCGGRLRLGYHFTCHICGETYCYIHMARHSRAHAPRPVEPGQIYAR
jgi:hypothetical protein